MEFWSFILNHFSHFFLSFIYLGLAVLSIIWRVRNVTEATVWQKSFVVLFVLATITRSIVFFIQPLITDGTIQPPKDQIPLLSKAINYYSVVPSYFVLASYLVIVFLWAEIYNSRVSQMKNYYKHFIVVLTILAIITAILCICDHILSPSHEIKPTAVSVIQKFLYSSFSLYYLITSIAFLFFGIRFYQRFSKHGALLQQTRFVILPKIQLISMLNFVCFVIRAIIILLAAVFADAWKSIFWSWVDLLYYFILEFIPLTLMLFILQKQNPVGFKKPSIAINEARA